MAVRVIRLLCIISCLIVISDVAKSRVIQTRDKNKASDAVVELDDVKVEPIHVVRRQDRGRSKRQQPATVSDDQQLNSAIDDVFNNPNAQGATSSNSAGSSNELSAANGYGVTGNAVIGGNNNNQGNQQGGAINNAGSQQNENIGNQQNLNTNTGSQQTGNTPAGGTNNPGAFGNKDLYDLFINNAALGYSGLGGAMGNIRQTIAAGTGANNLNNVGQNIAAIAGNILTGITGSQTNNGGIGDVTNFGANQANNGVTETQGTAQGGQPQWNTGNANFGTNQAGVPGNQAVSQWNTGNANFGTNQGGSQWNTAAGGANVNYVTNPPYSYNASPYNTGSAGAGGNNYYGLVRGNRVPTGVGQYPGIQPERQDAWSKYCASHNYDPYTHNPSQDAEWDKYYDNYYREYYKNYILCKSR